MWKGLPQFRNRKVEGRKKRTTKYTEYTKMEHGWGLLRVLVQQWGMFDLGLLLDAGLPIDSVEFKRKISRYIEQIERHEDKVDRATGSAPG